MSWELNYYHDGVLVGDLFPISNGGFSGSVKRNDVGQVSFTVSLRGLSQWCNDRGFDIRRMFTPIRGTIKTVQKFDAFSSGDSMGGWLSATPTFAFASSGDCVVQFLFTNYLGLCAGAFLIPPYSYNDHFNLVAAAQINLIIERTFLTGAIWPITAGPSDTLAIVAGTIDAPKTLKDFLLERTDNTTGTGPFDVYADPDGEITLHTKYGLDLSASTTFSYPDEGGKYDLKEVSFPAWTDFTSDVFLTGAGNGYASVSGDQGAALFATAENAATIANTGYWQTASSQSDISDQTTLNALATGYVRNTDKPFVTPALKLDGDPFKLYSHDQGGDLWLGDVIGVDATDWVKPLLPIDLPLQLRIQEVNMAVDGLGHSDVSLVMMSND